MLQFSHFQRYQQRSFVKLSNYFRNLSQRRVQNPVKCLIWSCWQKQSKAFIRELLSQKGPCSEMFDWIPNTPQHRYFLKSFRMTSPNHPPQLSISNARSSTCWLTRQRNYPISQILQRFIILPLFKISLLVVRDKTVKITTANYPES